MTGPVEVRVPATGGVELAVRVLDHGRGVPVLLVHGLASNARLWDGVAGRLAELDHPVASVDQRGHGRSDKPDTGYDFATLTADLTAVVDSLGWPRPFVAGQSWGGNVVLELGLRQPDATRAVALVDGGTIELARRFPTWEATRQALTPPHLVGLTATEFEAMIRGMHPDWPETGIEGTLANMEVRADGTIAPWLTLDRHLTILGHLWHHRPSERYPLMQVPALLVPAGAARPQDVTRAESALPTVRTQWFAGADHDVHAQHPVAVADLFHAACDRGFWP